MSEIQAVAVKTVGPVRTSEDTGVDAAWALCSAINLVDTILHAGSASGGGAEAEAAALPDDSRRRSHAAELSSLGKAAEGFMQFLKRTKAALPRSNKVALEAAKNLAVAVFTRHQRAQQLRESKHEHEHDSDVEDEGEEGEEDGDGEDDEDDEEPGMEGDEE